MILKRILIIVDGLPAGGVERQIVELLNGFKGSQLVRISLCSLSRGGTREVEAKELLDQWIDIGGAANAGPGLLAKFPLLALRLLGDLKNKDIDVLHTYGCFSDVLGVLAAKRYGIPLINGSIRAARPRLNMRDRLIKKCLPYADRIVANSDAGLRSFDVGERGVVIHNGVDLTRFETVTPASVDGSPVLCMVGNFTDKKDQAALIKCLPMLRDEFNNLKLILIGKGKKVPSCKELSHGLHCDDRVFFIEDCDNPEPYIAAADLCFLLSNTEIHGEGISNAIIEYMALAKPVIASDCGGNKEIINGGETGFLVKNNDSTRIVQLTKQLLTDPALTKEMGRKGRMKIVQSFTIEKMISKYIDLYEEVLDTAG